MSVPALPVLESLVAYLDALGSEEFDDLLDRRPDVLAEVLGDGDPDGSIEVDLGRVAGLLASGGAVFPLIVGSTTGVVQVVEALAACSERVPVASDGLRGLRGLRAVDEHFLARMFEPPAQFADRDRAVALLGLADPAAVAAFDAVVERLVQRVLVWPEAGRLRLHPVLGELFARPLGLPLPAASLFAGAGAAVLARAVTALGGKGRANQGQEKLLATLVGLLADGDTVRRVVDGAPPPARDLLQSALAEGRASTGDSVTMSYGSAQAAGLAWLIEHGLAARDPADPYGMRHTVSREVVVAMRGPGWRAPFDPDPPAVPLDAHGGERLAAESSAAALSALLGASALFETVAEQPVSTLKTGGVGARELKRLAKECSLDEDAVRLWLYVGEHAGILEDQDGQILAHPDYDAWAALPPDGRFAALLGSWLDTPAWPTHHGFGAKRPSALAENGGYDEAAPMVRGLVLAALAGLPPGSGTSAAGVQALVRWHVPLLFRSNILTGGEQPAAVFPVAEPGFDAATGALVATVVAEAARLGLVAHGAPTPLYRALLGAASDADFGQVLDEALDNDDPAAAAAALFGRALSGLLPQTVHTVRIQADLTAVAAGLPAPALTALLDSCGVRESAGTAWIWRFGDASVRRFLDGGGSAQTLLNGLRAASVGPLPQALEYLIADAGRRHGRVVVQAVGSVVLAVDRALAAELLGDKTLTRLALRPLEAEAAPTVLVSGLTPEDTMDALRFAGYSPAGRHPDGTAVIARRTGPRSDPDRYRDDEDGGLFGGY